MKRLLRFIRSVLPADPTQLIFLAGIVCLIIAPHLRWWPVDTLNTTLGYFALTSLLDNQTQDSWRHFLVVARLPLVLGYAGGIIVCLWPGRYAVRRVVFYVLVPAVFGISLISWRFLSVYSQSSILLGHGRQSASTFDSARLTLWRLGPGFQISVFGIGLILIFLSRVAFNIGSLPLSLPNNVEITSDDSSWTRTRRLIWLSVIPAGTFIYFSMLPVAEGLQTLLAHFSAGEISSWPFALISFVSGLAPLVIAIQIFGVAGWRSVGHALGRCRPSYLGLSLLIAPAIEVVMRLGKYLFDYIYWGAYGYGRLPPPQFAPYFELPTHSLLFLLSLVLPALIEEIIFRALLQQQLVRRYGMWRGVFLAGIVWSAFHFFTDFDPKFAVTDVLWGVLRRVVVCLTLGFVLGWLTLRSGSIWPSTILHFSHNAIVYSSSRYEYAGSSLVRVALWALLAYLLYRYWPPRIAERLDASPDLPIDLMELGPA